MTVQSQVSVQSQVFMPRDYDVFAGLDVDHHSIAATFTDHGRLMQIAAATFLPNLRPITTVNDSRNHQMARPSAQLNPSFHTP